MKKILLTIWVIILLGVVIFYGFKHEQKIWEIEILNDSVNVRRGAGVGYPLLDKVKKGERYIVKSMLDTDPSYNWYLIKLDNYREGWMATPKDGKWLLDINSPHGDLYPPRLKYYEEEVSFKSEDSITYTHLEVKDENEATISHVIYEEKVIEAGGTQYWITYLAEDAEGNFNTITQKATFDKIPTKIKIKN